MSFNTKTFEIIEPKSFTKSEYADYEFMLAWFGYDGSIYWHLFTDWENSNSTDVDIINIRDADSIENIPMLEDRKINLTVEDISKNDLEIFLSIKTAKKIIRLYNDSTFEFVGIDKNSVSYTQSDRRYNFSFDIILYQRALPQ